nr:HEAT repeat domain-containing protein [Candidatus Solincola tengchongensis]
MRELDSRSAARRAEAARRLGRIGASEAVPRLRDLLGDGDMEVRQAASQALERMEHGGRA